MAGSLQDQLLGAGLIKAQKAKEIKTSKRKAKKKGEDTDEAAQLAKDAQDEQRRRSQALNAQRKQEAELKAIAAQVRQIIQMNSIERKLNDDALVYNFTDDGKVKSLHMPGKLHDLVSRGRLAIARLDDDYALIPSEAAQKIQERDAQAIVLLNDNSQPDPAEDEDDPYADYKIPDDLMW